MNVPYFGLEKTVESFLGLHFRYLCFIICCYYRQPATIMDWWLSHFFKEVFHLQISGKSFYPQVIISPMSVYDGVMSVWGKYEIFAYPKRYAMLKMYEATFITNIFIQSLE